MSTTKEYREFFLRAVKKLTGAYPDKEANFPIKEIVVDQSGNSTDEFNRFLKTHFPSESVFKKLFESIAFKLNDEDTATVDEQGLVRIAVGYDIINRNDIVNFDENGNNKEFTTVVVPSELPVVTAAPGSDVTVTPIIKKVSDGSTVGSITPGDKGLYYVEYQIDYNTPSIPTSTDNIIAPTSIKEAKVSDLNTDPDGATRLEVLTHLIPTDTLKTGADELDYIIIIEDQSEDGDAEPFGKIEVYLSKDTNFNNGKLIYTCTESSERAPDSGSVIKINLKVIRNSNTGYFAISERKLFTRTPLNATDTNGYIENSTNFSSNTDLNHYFSKELTNSSVDWTDDMYVLVRYNLDGNSKASITKEFVTVIGKAIVNG
jgi:hypothetical protein